MIPTSGAEPLLMGEFSRPDGARHPHHPPTYEIRDPAEIRAVTATEPHATTTEPAFVCMCGEPWEDPHLTEDAVRLRDPLSPDGIPARHRARWVAAAPGGLRGYARALAGGEEEPDRPRGMPFAVVFGWLGAVREEPRDAAWLLAERGPGLLLAVAPADELARAVLEADRAGLEGAVRFFASEEFTTRHPKRRRVPDAARDVLLRYARGRRPGDLAVLERRLLRVPEDRVRRS
ncbi:hypothetical protein [Streptomyces sp. NPDC059564]|uniref:hypothetical protein n=1 Tax=Streptomyces sp. NPDC059564 TaxID=3346865 RepID=UPI0036C8D468